MNKDIYNKLDIIEQVEYINRELERGKSLRGIVEEIGIAKSTVIDRFKRNDYKYNKILKRYEKVEEEEKPLEVVEKKPLDIEEKITIDKLYSYYKALESRIKDLENKGNINSLNIKEFEGKAINRTYRIYEEVQEEFKIFCKRHSEYTVTDIISMALYEYMKRNK